MILNKQVFLKDSTISYKVFGEGYTHIICLHGHGRNPDDFEFLSEYGKVISLDLFFHGRSTFPKDRIEKNPILTREFLEIFLLLLENEKISQFHFVAFSQGGRFVLSILPFLGNQVQSIQLISPDGMDNNSFYNRMSRKKWARKLFLYFEKHPYIFIQVCKIARTIKLMRPKVFLFVQKFALDSEMFNRASKTWRGFRLIQPNEDNLKAYFNENQIPFKVLMGRYDQVIRTKQAVSFLKRIDQSNALQEVDCGHDFFGNKFKGDLEKIIRIPKV